MKKFQNLLKTFVPAALFSRLVIIGASIEFGFIVLTSPYTKKNAILRDISLQLLPIFTAFLILFIVFHLLSRRINEANLRTVLFITLPIGVAVGGAILGVVRREIGSDPTNLIGLWIFVACFHLIPVIFVLWHASSNLQLHQQRIEKLKEDRETLHALEWKADEALEILNIDTTETFRSRLRQELEQIRKFDARDTLSALVSTIENTIRPISRQLEKESTQWIPPKVHVKTPDHINWKAALTEGANVSFFSPITILAILAFAATPMNFVRVGPSFALSFIALTFLLGLPIYAGAKRLFLFLSAKANTVMRIFLFVSLCFLSGLIWGCATLLITWNSPKPFRFMILSPTFTLLFAYILGIALAANKQASDIEFTLKETSNDLKWEITRKRELHRQQQSAFAHALHGRLQAALTAAILELNQAIELNEISDEKLHSVRKRIANCIEDLNFRERKPLDIGSIWDKVLTTWMGVANLSLAIDPKLEVTLKLDPQALTSLNDVIPELVFNSIRHGRASRIYIRIEYEDLRTLRLIVEDDGERLDTKGERGMGSGLFDTCSTGWSRSREGSLTVTQLLIPIEQGAQV